MKKFLRMLASNRGEAGSEEGGQAPEPKFTQEDINRIVATTRKEIQGKYGDYEDLMKFKQEHEQQQTEIQRKQQEEAGRYEEAKKGYEAKIGEFTSIIQAKDEAINSMKVGFTLQSEVSKQNGYPEAVELVKSQAVVQEDGSVKIKGKDSNGLDTLLSIEDGVKAFLSAKPYLVKASAQGGSGSTPNVGAGSQVVSDDHSSLNDKLAVAMRVGNHKQVAEITQKLKDLQMQRGISSVI